ncbi:MAG: hypothetical protein ABL907_08095 [Hyphomicrobium sp.]
MTATANAGRAPWSRFPLSGTSGTAKPARVLDQVAAIASAGLLVVMAAMPDDGLETAAGQTAAASGPAASSMPGRETSFGAYLGAPYHYPSDFTLKSADAKRDLTIKNVDWYTHPFDNPLYYGARIQRWSANGTTGSMVDFVHSKAYAPKDQEAKLEGTLDGQPVPATGKIGDFFKKLEFSHGHNMLTLNGLVRFAGFSNVVVPYAGAGAGVSLPHSEMQLQTETGRTYEYQYTGPTAQALAGLELRLRTGSVFFEYKFTIADYRAPHTMRDGSLFPVDMWSQFQRWWSGAEPPGGWGAARLTSHQVVGGFLVRFVPETAVVP